jgi:hypothetical protein
MVSAPSAAAACQAQRGSSRNPARQRDAIRMTVGNDRFRLVRVDDHADRLHRNAAGVFDGGGGASNAHAECPLARPDLADRGGHFDWIAHAVAVLKCR